MPGVSNAMYLQQRRDYTGFALSHTPLTPPPRTHPVCVFVCALAHPSEYPSCSLALSSLFPQPEFPGFRSPRRHEEAVSLLHSSLALVSCVHGVQAPACLWLSAICLLLFAEPLPFA